MHGVISPKIYYATQVSSQPPTLVLMCNDPRAFTPTYRRYLLSVLRDQLRFGEVPMKLYLKRRRNEDNRDEVNSHQGPKIKEGPADGSLYHHEHIDDEDDDIEDDNIEDQDDDVNELADDSTLDVEVDSEYEVTDGSHG